MLSQMNRRDFCGLMGRIGGALGLMPVSELSGLIAPAQAGTRCLSELAELFRNSKALGGTAGALRYLADRIHSFTNPIPGVPLPSRELFEFQTAKAVHSLLSDGELFRPGNSAMELLRPYFSPEAYPGLAHTESQRRSGIKMYMLHTLPPLDLGSMQHSDFYLDQYVGRERGNEPTSEQVKAWKSFQTARLGLLEEIQNSGTTPELEERGARLSRRIGREPSLESVPRYALDSMLDNLRLQQHCGALIAGAIREQPLHNNAAAWEYLKVFEDPSRAAVLLADPSFLLRARYTRAMQQVDACLKFGQEPPVEAVAELKELTPRLIKENIRLPEEYKANLEHLKRMHPDFDFQRGDIVELLRLPEAGSASRWKEGRGGTAATVWKSFSNPQPLAELSFRGSHWRATFRASHD